MHAVWNNYHEAWCRYRQLQVEVIRQIREEMDPRARGAREEAAFLARAREDADVDLGQLFEPVCPRCKEPLEPVSGVY